MQQEQSFDIPLHDIKTVVPIEDYSFYYLLAISAVVLLFVGAMSYLLYKWYKSRNRYNKRKEHFDILNSIDFANAKQSAYDLTLYGATFKDDSLRHKEMYENIINRLENYKYKKEVDAFDSEMIGYIKLYIGMVDV
ncbi:MAG: hypothetical protein QG559_315 [Campylobacterota bacterium]|nr:hypothetical protein [Campylobacterota bacterium]